MKTSESIVNISKALVNASSECSNPTHNQKGYGYTYADLGNIIDGTKPILLKHGLTICQTVAGDGSNVIINTRLIHVSGEYIEDSLTLPHVALKGTNEVQNMGASITYGRRYAYCGMLNIQAEKDTDGVVGDKKQSNEKPQIPKVSMDAIKELCTQLGWAGEELNEYAFHLLKKKVNWKDITDTELTKIYEGLKAAI